MSRLILRSAFVLACASAALVPLKSKEAGALAEAAPVWPAEWDGTRIDQVPLGDHDERFNRNFPGKIAKFTDGRRELILRWVTKPTRQLHSSAECFRGMGYAIRPQPAIRDVAGRRWSCFLATNKKTRLHVQERITGESGAEWTDVSAWFWGVTFQRKRGPWLSVTVIENIR
jgi:hypothetical protein